jgi:hypothetical protein
VSGGLVESVSCGGGSAESLGVRSVVTASSESACGGPRAAEKIGDGAWFESVFLASISYSPFLHENVQKIGEPMSFF